MEDLAKFFADIIEFIVGGVLFLASLLLFVNAVVVRVPMHSVTDDWASRPTG